ncbi:hypothetical protein LHFGNBLO_000050 [Mesorhizobium sp. AR10]|uniref:hypothetical protein n=1 Tax=Mesorhizobium sp. AR10 TaxID=2865839 RepID=UPI002160469B|nr:hypothetical protein [Mesorhizobium sp. AR10]UVK38766.1 hypothetical protein LHFGNBLO_000050 [Mesorhizobium sp. AR10]
MTVTKSKPTGRKTIPITDPRDLIWWLAAAAKASEPQVEMPKGMIRLFDIVVTEFVEEGVLEVPWDWSEWFSDQLYSLYELETETCSARVSWLATNCYAELINRGHAVYADYFIKALAAGVLSKSFGAGATMEFTVVGPITKVRSTSAFHSIYGFKVRVDVGNCAPEVNPHGATITSRWLKDL